MPRTTSTRRSTSPCATFDDLVAPARRGARAAAPGPGDGRDPLPRTSCAPTRAARGWPRTSTGSPGCALALRREGVWGLSLLVVRPGLQSAGVGRALLRARARVRATARAGGSSSPRPTRGRCAPTPGSGSTCTRAVRRKGDAARRARARRRPRRATRDDIPFTEAVDRHVRGARARRRHRAQLDDGPDAADRARARLRRRSATVGCGLLAAFDDDGARDLLRAVLARADGEVTVSFITAAQQWAIEVCVEAGLDAAHRRGASSSAATSGRSRPTCRAAPSCEPGHKLPPALAGRPSP